MKVAVLLMVTILLQVTLLGNCQNVSFSGRNVPLKEIFSVIKAQTGVFFFYDASLLREAKPVTITLKNVTLETALNGIFKGQSLAWVLEGRTITVIKRSAQIAIPPAVAAQPPPATLVRGSITNEEGDPIAGVTVMIKGTRQGTLSDNAGRFSIKADQKHILIFSYLNYDNKEVKVEKGEMNIRLQLAVKPVKFIGWCPPNAVKRKSETSSVTVLD
jgi:hypothetical protein